MWQQIAAIRALQFLLLEQPGQLSPERRCWICRIWNCRFAALCNATKRLNIYHLEGKPTIIFERSLWGLIHMSKCIYLLWWKEDVASSRVWANVGFTCKTRSKRDGGQWGDSKNEIGFDVYIYIYLWTCCCSLSRFNIPQLVLEWYGRIKTSRQGNRQMADKVRRKKTRSKTRSDPTPTRHPTSHCRTGQVLGTSPES